MRYEWIRSQIKSDAIKTAWKMLRWVSHIWNIGDIGFLEERNEDDLIQGA